MILLCRGKIQKSSLLLALGPSLSSPEPEITTAGLLVLEFSLSQHIFIEHLRLEGGVISISKVVIHCETLFAVL